MTSSIKIASRVNAVVASEVQRAEELALKEIITDDVDH
jgi:hypothetical protein